jgi:peptidyl-prolyl cis-trans isomerase B (cyclophilin B)
LLLAFQFVGSGAAKIVLALTAAAASILAVTLASGGGSGYRAAAGRTGAGSQSQNHPAISSFLDAAASKTCVYTATHSGRRASLPSARVNTEVRYTAVLRTNLGDIAIGLNSRAPCTVNSFVHLAELGFFNGTQCQRLVTAGIYVLQCGDPYTTAKTKLTCSPSNLSITGTPGYEFASENLKGATYPAGTVAMANDGGPDSNGSQFFIVYKDSTSGLSPTYTPFGTVSSGLNIVRAVARAGYKCEYTLAGGGVPSQKVVINSVTITRERLAPNPAAA